MGHQPKTIGDYVTIQEIGAGSFAVVWKARHRMTGQEVAIKEIGTDKLNNKLQDSLQSEIAILKKANHPNIIRLHGIVEAPDRIYLILEYCAGGDLAGYIHRHGKVGEATARNFMQQLGSGLQVLRKNNLIHRDLKPQNLLLSTKDKNAVLKIADFGFARSLQPQGMAETLCGSPLYMAPEILQCQKYDAKADLWSVGAILYQLVVGKPPFSGNNHVQLLNNITKNEVQFPLGAQLHPDCIDMCRKLLRRNPVERLSFEEFFNHPFMRPSTLGSPLTKSNTTDVEMHQEECFPFLLDDEQPGTSLTPAAQQPRYSPPYNRMTKRPESPPHIFKEPKGYIPDYEDSGKHILNQRPTETDAEGPGSPKTVMDSMECIEREYVVVKRFTSPESLSFSVSPIDPHGSKACSPHKSLDKVRSGSPVRPSTSPESLHLESGDSIEGPSTDPATRLASLQSCARVVAELANDKFNAGSTLEALVVQLICLAIWKEALQVSYKLAEEQGAYREEIEKEFSLAIDRGDIIASQFRNMDGSGKVPDAIEIIFEAALAAGKLGAVEELMGNMANASAAYERAVTFLYFLIVEGPYVQHLNPPALLTQEDRRRLKRYAEMITGRLNACKSQKDQDSTPPS